ncbi:hypothetical protein ACWCYY_01555 [Kitasatospora sp. NPDC001664]|uniref:hypothetical protein n=1 Tax=Kitasatospora albolonga TaxID=68173 RepID=UPI0035F01522
MFQHDVFVEKVKVALVRAGLPIASTWNPELSSGVQLEVADGEQLPPSAYLKWRVHPSVQTHFLSVPHAELLADPEVKAMTTAQAAMHAAITAVLEQAGFSVREAAGQRVGELLIAPQE